MLYKAAGCISVSICIIIALIVIAVWSRKWREKKQRGELIYFVRMLPFLSAIIAGGVVMFLCFAIGCIFGLDGGQLVVALLIFLGFDCLGMAAYFCAMFWMIAVNEETGVLTYYHPPLRPVKVHISEITRVQILENRLNSPEQYRIKVYRGEKKLFEISDMWLGYRWLRAYLEKTTADSNEPFFYEYDPNADKNYKIEKGYLRAGETELAEQKNEFSVTATARQKAGSGIATLIWLAMDSLLIFNWNSWVQEDEQFFFYFAVLLFITAVSLSEFIPKMLFKISVSNHEISVRKGVRKELVYTMREISRVETKGNFIVLYMGSKRIAKISKECENAIILADWLERQIS